MPDPDGPPERELDRLKFIRSEIRFESDTVGERLSALLSSQSFLVIAYASSMGASHEDWGAPLPRLLPPALSVLGIVLVLCAWPGLRAGHAVLGRWRGKERELLTRCPALASWTLMDDEGGQRDVDARRREGALFAQRAPLVLILAWAFFAALPFWLRHAAGS